ncbi:MAG: ABC transporter permease [Solirubrobacterales bacterium]
MSGGDATTKPTAAGPGEAAVTSRFGLPGQFRFASHLLPAALLILAVALAGVLVPSFLTIRNELLLLQQMAIIGVVAIGMHYVILTAGIDLSVGSILELSTVIFALALAGGWPLGLALAAALAAGLAAGLVNGLCVTLLNVQPFVVTLATLAIFGGLALLVTNGTPVLITNKSPVMDFLGNGDYGGIPGQFILLMVLAFIGWFVLRFTPFGRYVYAVGGSAETARLAGIRVKLVLTSVYAIAGLCAGLAGIMTAARLSTGTPTAGSLTNLDAIAAVVIGGTSLMGGRGSLWASVAGALTLAVIANIIVLLGFSPFQAQIIRGVIILVAVALGAVSLTRASRSSSTREPPSGGGLAPSPGEETLK